jgi:hypothetical protein
MWARPFPEPKEHIVIFRTAVAGLIVSAFLAVVPALASGATHVKLKGYHSATAESVTVSGSAPERGDFLEVYADDHACARTNAEELDRTVARHPSAGVAFTPQVENGPFTEPTSVPQTAHVRYYVCAYLFSGAATVARAKLSYRLK